MSSGAVVLLDSAGALLVLENDGLLRPLARLPSGHYHRTHMAMGPDGSVFISSGFQIRRIYRVSPAGVVTVVAGNLADPEGIAVDDEGDIYVAESALHRIIRIRPAVTRPPPSRR
jgi:sugar lactone lactonase YvrE